MKAYILSAIAFFTKVDAVKASVISDNQSGWASDLNKKKLSKENKNIYISQLR